MSKQQWSLEILKGTKQEQYAMGKMDADVILARGKKERQGNLKQLCHRLEVIQKKVY